MANNKIISFSGRLGSGKSELASVCEKYGYEKLYFAKPLKMLVAKLIGVDESEINSLKNVEKEYNFNASDYLMLSDETGIPVDTIEKAMSGVEFKTVRQLLQFIGTDIIRRYNADWHVEKIKEMIEDGKSYVFDDVRFHNELKLIKDLGGDAWFIVRPIIDNISNHISEIDLSWKDFGDMVIINDTNLAMFKTKWDIFMSSYDNSIRKRKEFMENNGELSRIYTNIKEPLGVMDVLELSPSMFSYEERIFDESEIKEIKKDDKLGVVILKNDGSVEIVNNPLSIEDLKIFIKDGRNK